MSPTRREFLAGSAGALAAGTLVGGGLMGGTAGADGFTDWPYREWPSWWSEMLLPKPKESGIDHIIVVMMENRSFDHYLGWLPGADGRQKGLKFRDKDNNVHRTHRLTNFQNCDSIDPIHTFDGGRTQLNKGACDGFLKTNPSGSTGDTFPIGYYTQDQLDFFGKAAPYWTTFDRYFAATMGPTMPNRFYQHAAQTDRTHGHFEGELASMPTIWDRLRDAGVSSHYYYSDVPYIALFGPKYLPISYPLAIFLAQCALGTLPSVSFVEPQFLDLLGEGTSGDDHPHADIRAGQHFLNTIYKAVTNGPKWDRTALVINYDEWGGFFDHVPPRVAPDATPDVGTGQRGFRVPAMMISPRARRGYVAHQTYDHTSILKMIEWRFGLRPLTVRDKAARNMAEVLDFWRKPRLEAPQYDVPFRFPLACWTQGSSGSGLQRSGAGQERAEISELAEVATKAGFEIFEPE